MEQLTGRGDIVDRDGMPVARLRYRLRIFPAGEGRFGRAGYVALALDLSGDQFAVLGALGRQIGRAHV